MRLTRHNGRAGKYGVYNPKHNDRSFDVGNSEHIDAERVSQNIYWDCFNGYRTIDEQGDPDKALETFSDIELVFYKQNYTGYIEGQNARNALTRHTERNRTIEQVLANKKTCPEETVYQIGTMDEHISEELLLEIVTEFMAELDRRFGSRIHTLDWALHMDESTPHIHERHVFDAENQYGEIFPQQEKALEELGFELPNPARKASKFNNRKMVFDAACRLLLFDIAEKHGLRLEREPEYGGRKYLEKQDFILMQQKKKLEQGEAKLSVLQTAIADNAEQLGEQNVEISANTEKIISQEEQLEELTLKIEDVEMLIDEVADIAYDKAVEVVTAAVKVETHKEDLKLVEQSKAWVLSPERKASKKEIEYAAKRLDGVITKITNAMKSTLQKFQTTLMKPEVKKEGTEQIKKKARNSILEKLHRNKAESTERKATKNPLAATKNRIWNFKALAIFKMRMTGVFCFMERKCL